MCCARRRKTYGKKMSVERQRNCYPDENRQHLVTKAICAVKTSARFGLESGRSPIMIIDEILKHASAPMILGCTDLRVAFGIDERIPDAVCIDSLDCLANTIVALHRGNGND